MIVTVFRHRVNPEARDEYVALLTRIVTDYRQAGVERFFLVATEAGRPLYESIGFETVADLSLWVLGHSTQAHA